MNSTKTSTKPSTSIEIYIETIEKLKEFKRQYQYAQGKDFRNSEIVDVLVRAGIESLGKTYVPMA